jgi:hypothetical protein
MKFFAFVFVLATACGGAVDSPLFDGGPESDSSSNDATVFKDAPTTSDGAIDCNALLSQLQSQAQAAEQCCATCDSLQCTFQVAGLCCPLTVESATSDATNAYLATLNEIKNGGCAVDCPGMSCSTKPSGNCKDNGQGMNGLCAQN